ncbi:hypothetical protein [Frigidibacter sp. MR17.24]|uniref:hypothetical protein n=1 Tax=Frigidibacter sp. MR17.24 TaxID=3127345 RepID=UPI003012CFF0
MEIREETRPAQDAPAGKPHAPQAESEGPPWWQAKREAIEIRKRIKRAYEEARRYQSKRAPRDGR